MVRNIASEEDLEALAHHDYMVMRLLLDIRGLLIEIADKDKIKMEE